MTELQKGRRYGWEDAPCNSARMRDFPPRVNISERIKDLTKADRRAVFERLQFEEPDIALFVQRFAETFGRMDLYLDPKTAQRVLAVLDRVTEDRLDGRGQ